MTDTRFCNLYNFLSGYFHQDYLDEYADDTALLRAFRTQNPASLVAAVAHELRLLLATVPADEMSDDFLLLRLGCYGGPAEGTSNSDWLAWILKQLDYPSKPK
jgi:hypothetical protein